MISSQPVVVQVSSGNQYIAVTVPSDNANGLIIILWTYCFQVFYQILFSIYHDNIHQIQLSHNRPSLRKRRKMLHIQRMRIIIPSIQMDPIQPDKCTYIINIYHCFIWSFPGYNKKKCIQLSQDLLYQRTLLTSLL